MNSNVKINTALISHWNKAFVPMTSDVVDREKTKQVVATMVMNLESYGYTLSEKMMQHLFDCRIDNLISYYHELVETLASIKGADYDFRPFYVNFPKQVMEMSEVELYINAMIHYICNYDLDIAALPATEKKKRFPLIGIYDLTVIDIASQDDFENLCLNIMSSNTSISSDDKELIELYFNTVTDELILPSAMPNKENMAVVAKCLIEDGHEAIVSRVVKTATDVLRVAVALSDGDVSLAEKTKFKRFNRPQRRMILDMLDTLDSDITEDMLRHKSMWLRLGETLHPFEYYKQYPTAADGFANIRNKTDYKTFSASVENAIKEDRIEAAVSLLCTRPGVFARKLDHILSAILRTPCTKDRIDCFTTIALFASVANKVSIPVLMQVSQHFKNRHLNHPRIVMPKGPTAKMHIIEDGDNRVQIPFSTQIAEVCDSGIMRQLSSLPDIGNVYLGEGLDNFNVPFSQRSASSASKTVARGSRFQLTEGNTIRFFCYWKGNHVDVDLSAAMFDADWNYLERISYTNLRSASYKAYHSGDITRAPNGASEFIDLDINQALHYGARYVTMNVYSYSGQPFNQIEPCFSGWMTRQDVESGEIYEPKTVQIKMDHNSKSTKIIPIIVDLKTREVIWADMNAGQGVFTSNIENTLNTTQLICKGITDMSKFNLLDLFELHVKARNGTIVDNKEDADIVFDLEDADVTPFSLDIITSQYMG